MKFTYFADDRLELPSDPLSDSLLSLVVDTRALDGSLAFQRLEDGSALIQIEVVVATVEGIPAFFQEVRHPLTKYLASADSVDAVIVTVECRALRSIHTFVLPPLSELQHALDSGLPTLIENADAELVWRSGKWKSLYPME